MPSKRMPKRGITVRGVETDPRAGRTIGLAREPATGRTRLYVDDLPGPLLEPGAVVDQALIDEVRQGRGQAR